MSQDLLEKILINETICDIQELIKFLLLFEKGNFIYPSVIKRKFNIEDKEVYKILSILEKEKVLKMFYEVVCYQCSKTINLFEYYSQLNDTIYCEDCDLELQILDNVKIVYKVEK